MNTKAKLYLSIDRELLQKIKEAAKKDNRTLSNYVETVLFNNVESK